MKTEVMSLQEFLDKSRRNEFKQDKNNEALKTMLSAAGYFALYSTTVYAGPFDAAGNRFWVYAKNFAYWAYLVMGCVEGVKQVQNGDHKGIWKVLLKYGAAYGMTAALPWLFKEIDSAFSINPGK